MTERLTQGDIFSDPLSSSVTCARVRVRVRVRVGVRAWVRVRVRVRYLLRPTQLLRDLYTDGP